MTALDTAKQTVTEIEATSYWATCKNRPTTHLYKAHAAALATIAALTPPPPRRYGLGASAHTLHYGAGADAYLTRVKSLGATIIRDDVYIGSSTATMDRIGQLAKAHDLKLDLILANNLAKIDPQRMHDGAKALVSYFDANYPGVLEAVEPMNEPNGHAYATDPAGYAALASAVYDAVHDLGSKTKAWAGTSGLGLTGDWTLKVLQAGVRFDEWTCHPYLFYTDCLAADITRLDHPTPWSQVFWQAPTLAALLSQFGYGGPIHATEAGVPTHGRDGTHLDTATSVEQQAEYYRLALPQWFSQDRAGYFFAYTPQDDVSVAPTTREETFGVFYADGTEKPAASVVRSAAA
jgi:hypothetical protein